MGFRQKDTQIYDEGWVEIDVAKTAGNAEVVQDCFGFWLVGGAAEDKIVFVYRMRQVEADKATGSGEEIEALDRLYYYPSLDTVSANAVGTAGTDYYFCGWAKLSADADDDTVLMNFDGTRWDEDI